MGIVDSEIFARGGIYGSTAVGGHLYLNTTSDATKGAVILSEDTDATAAGVGSLFGFGGASFVKRVFAGAFIDQSVTLTTGSYTSYDVSAIGTLICNTIDGNITINGLTGGVAGQKINFVKTSTANNLIVVHNGTSTQKLFTETSANITKGGYGGFMFVCTGVNWFSSDH